MIGLARVRVCVAAVARHSPLSRSLRSRVPAVAVNQATHVPTAAVNQAAHVPAAAVNQADTTISDTLFCAVFSCSVCVSVCN